MTETVQVRNSAEIINAFIEADTDWLAEIVEKHPQQIPLTVIAEKFGCSQDTIRENLESKGLLGISERKPGKLNRGFVIPTAHFIRWYMCVWHF